MDRGGDHLILPRTVYDIINVNMCIRIYKQCTFTWIQILYKYIIVQVYIITMRSRIALVNYNINIKHM